MMFLEQFSFSLKFLYFFGFKPPLKTRTKIKRIVDLVPVVVTSFLCGTFTIYLLFFPHFSSYGIVFVLIYFGSLVPSTMMILTATGWCHFNKNEYKAIINQIGKLEKQMDEKSIRHSLKCVAFRYKLKFLLLYSTLFLSQMLVYIEVWIVHPGREWSSVILSMIRATYPLQLLHFVLYSDIATMFFKQLNEKFNQTPISVRKSDQIEFLKYVKLVHYDLWKLIDEINTFFGWNLLFMTMFWFIYITHQLYWIFLNTQEKVNVLQLFGW